MKIEKRIEAQKNKKKQWQEFKDDNLRSMDISYQELRRILDPVFHNKTINVNGKLLKDCFRHIGDIIHSHHFLRSEWGKTETVKDASLGGKNE